MMEKKGVTLMGIGLLLKNIIRVLKSRIGNIENEDFIITPEQFGLLHAISVKEEDVIQKDMAEIMGKDKSAILRLIDILEEKGLVRKVADTNDRRKNYIMVTKKGEKGLEQYKVIVRKLMGEIQQDIDPTEVEIFQKVLYKLLANIEKL